MYYVSHSINMRVSSIQSGFHMQNLERKTSVNRNDCHSRGSYSKHGLYSQMERKFVLVLLLAILNLC